MSVERGVAKKSIRGEEDEPWETVGKGQRWTRVERRGEGSYRRRRMRAGKGGRDGLSFYHLSLSTRFS